MGRSRANSLLVNDFAALQRRWLQLTILVVVVGTLLTALHPDARVWHGFLLGGVTAILHLRLLHRSVARFGTKGLKLNGAAVRIVMVGIVLFLSAKRPDVFLWWATFAGFLTEKVAMGLALVLPNFWPSQRGN